MLWWCRQQFLCQLQRILGFYWFSYPPLSWLSTLPATTWRHLGNWKDWNPFVAVRFSLTFQRPWMDWTRFGQGKDKMTLWIGFMGVLKSFFIFSFLHDIVIKDKHLGKTDTYRVDLCRSLLPGFVTSLWDGPNGVRLRRVTAIPENITSFYSQARLLKWFEG